MQGVPGPNPIKDRGQIHMIYVGIDVPQRNMTIL